MCIYSIHVYIYIYIYIYVYNRFLLLLFFWGGQRRITKNSIKAKGRNNNRLIEGLAYVDVSYCIFTSVYSY